MLKRLAIITAALLASAHAQSGDWTVGATGVYTSTAKIYLYPKADDEIVRNNFHGFENLYGPSLTLSRRVGEEIRLSLNVGYVAAEGEGANATILLEGGTRTVPVKEGFVAVPIEISLQYFLPFSFETVKFFMGGGIGAYVADRTRTIGDLESETIERRSAFGVHVGLSIEWFVVPDVALVFGMKFRDPQIDVVSRYNGTTGVFEGETFSIVEREFDSKINLDGVVFLVGASYSFDVPGI
jgi:opacity protein-like surface antigen